jgi:spermidine/putrescine transport system substrate-binding protein
MFSLNQYIQDRVRKGRSYVVPAPLAYRSSSGSGRADAVFDTHPSARKSRPGVRFAISVLGALIAALVFISGCSQDEPPPAPAYTIRQQSEKNESPEEQPSVSMLTVLCRLDYLPEALVSDFTAQTGITVVIADPAEHPDLTAADGSFDLALVDSLRLPVLIDEGMLARIDRTAMPNTAAVSPAFSTVPFDPDGVFCVPFLWGTFGIVVNRSAVIDSRIDWDILFNYRYIGKIDMPDDARLILDAALRSLGTVLDDADTVALNRAIDLLYEQRKTIRGYFQIPDIVDHLVEGSSYISCIDNSSAAGAIDKNPELEYIVPSSGAPLWLLVWIIPVASENVSEARRFIDFFLDPERIASVSNVNRIANTVLDSGPYLDDTLVNTPTIILPEDVSARCRLPGPIDLETENLIMRLRDDFMLP